MKEILRGQVRSYDQFLTGGMGKIPEPASDLPGQFADPV